MDADMTDRKIEDVYEKIRELERAFQGHLSTHSASVLLRANFPEAFVEPKHWAIERLDNLILEAEGNDGLAPYWVRQLRGLRSAFNSDGTLKETK